MSLARRGAEAEEALARGSAPGPILAELAAAAVEMFGNDTDTDTTPGGTP